MPTGHLRKNTLVMRLLSALTMALSIATHAAEAPTTFDGQWDATLICPPHNEDDDAKGYTHRFPAEIRNGYIKGVYGTEGQPGWHTLSGPLAPDGSAMLKLDGIVSRPDYAINKAWAGKAYTYRVRARFEANSGSGQRMGQRKCELQFVRR